jgi:hypothetical protein
MANPYTRVTSWNSRLRQLGLTALLLGGATVAAHAQGLSYTTSSAANTTSTFTDLGTTGTAITTANSDDANSAAQNIGFTFSYNGASFTQFVLNTNGLIRLGADAPSAANMFLQNETAATNPAGVDPVASTNAADVNLLMPFSFDLEAGTGASPGSGVAEYRVATTGTSPNQVCTIQWKNVHDKAATNASQYASFTFQLKLYEGTNRVEFVYSPTTAATTGTEIGRYATVGLKGSGSAAGQVLLASKGSSATAWSGATFVAATTPRLFFRRTVGPDAGRTFRFQVAPANDAAVNAIYTLGKLPIPWALPSNTIQVAIQNTGSTTLTNLPVTLAATGANTFSSTQTVATLAAGASILVPFPYPTTLVAGTNNLTASVPADAVLTNNSATWQQEVNTTATFSYVPSDQPNPTTAFGGGTAGLIFANKYTTSTAASVTTVRVLIGDVSAVGKTVAGVVLTPAGAILSRSADYVVQAGDVGTYKTFTIGTPPTIAAGGSFLAGLAQLAYTGAQYFPLGVQTESPARTGTYYTVAVAGGAPADAAANGVRFMIEAQTTTPISISDASVVNIYTLGKIITPAGLPHAVQAVVTNTGNQALTNVPVTLTVTGANTFTNTQTVASLAVGASAKVTFANYPATLALGTNTVTVTLAADGNNNNNSLAVRQLINTTRQSYIAPDETAPSSALGQGTADGILASKFTASSPLYISSVSDFILNTTSSPVGHTMYAVILSSTGAILGRSADYVVKTADLDAVKTLDLTTPVTVPAGDYYVGIAQPASPTAFYPVGLIAETPTRTGAFFAFDLTGGTPEELGPYNFGRFMIEAISVVPPACSGPTALAASSITATGATITFTPPASGAASYELIYGPTGFDPTAGGTTVAVTGSPFTLTGLSAATTYQVYVRSVCTGGGNSAYAGPISLSTPCGPAVVSAFPYSEGFDAIATGQALPCGITRLDANNDKATWAVNRTAPYAGVNALRYTSAINNSVAADDWFFTPGLTTAANTRYQVAFRYRGEGIVNSPSSYTEKLEVKVGPSATPAGQTTTLYSNTAITNTSYALANATSTPAVAVFTPGAGTQYVGFHVFSDANQGNLYIDDLSITTSVVTATTSEALLRAVSVFPNPSTTGAFDLEIHGANAKGSLSVLVTNTLGQVMYTGTARDNFTNKLNLTTLAPGLYSLQIRNGDETMTRQLAIVK